jgi:hypothetical protein
MSSTKKIYLQSDFAAGVYLSEAPSPPMTHTHKGRGGELTREKVRGATVHNAGSKKTNMTDCITSL